jgi:hypothetical protein
MKVAGAPIGDDALCADFVGAKVDNALTKLQTLSTHKSGFICWVYAACLSLITSPKSFRLHSRPITSAVSTLASLTWCCSS